MLKWIGRIIYVVAVLYMSVFVFTLSYQAKLQDYYDSEIRENVNNDEILLRGLNTLYNIEYYRESPILYQFEQLEGNHQFTLTVYAIGGYLSDTPSDGMMLVINNIKIIEDGELIEDPVIKISVTSSHQTFLVNDEYIQTASVTYDPLLPYSTKNAPALFIFDAEDFLLIPNEDDQAPNEYATLTRITLDYSNGKNNDNGKYVYDSKPLFIASPILPSDAAYAKDDDFSIDPSLYKIRENFIDEGLTDEVISTYNLNTETDDLSPYNKTIWKILLIYFFSLTVVTYFAFFHRIVKERKAMKKRMEEKAKLANNPNTLFKELDDDVKDGK